MEASIIIRVKNERENLQKLFEILKNQTYQKFEIIIVDNNSIDGSDRAFFDFFPKDRVRILKINKFSYPSACNLGAEKAQGKYLVYLSAHSFPVLNTWLEDGLSNFGNEKVAGVFAFPKPGSTIWEKISYRVTVINVFKEGHLGNTNSIIRKDLWEKHKFDESLVEGSEDYEWSKYYKRKGYLIINDPSFSVYHSHNLDFRGRLNQQKKWNRLRREIDEKFKH